MIIRNIIKSLRLYQFHKNLIIFAPLFFSDMYRDPGNWGAVVTAFLLFTATSGVVYILNDLKDREKDRLHPVKRNRPIASGELAPAPALAGVVVILFLVAWACFQFAAGVKLMGVLLFYLSLMIFYNFVGRDTPILDILCVAIGFVIRVFTGGLVINNQPSPWLVICTFFAACILLFGKRYSELRLIGKEEASRYRKVYTVYDESLLLTFLSISYACSILSYCLYTISERTFRVHNTPYLFVTIPFVVYGIMRFHILIRTRSEILREPELFLLKDLPSLGNVILWLLTFFLVSRPWI